jgi:hypothetical protein
MDRFAFRECLIPYLDDDCISIIIKLKNDMEYFDELNLIFQSILYNKNKKKVELHENINLNDMVYHLDTFHFKFINEFNFHLYIYDNYSFCNTIRLNYNKLKDYSKDSLNICNIHRINNKRILLVLDEDYSKLDNISKISKGFKYYIKRCTNFIYIKMNIAYIKLCFIRT